MVAAAPIRLLRCARCRERIEQPTTGRPRTTCSVACRMALYRQRRRRSVHFRSDTDKWATDPEVFAFLAGLYGPFDLDPCCLACSAKAPRYYTPEDDGLAQPWHARRVWMNPPYGRAIVAWMRRAAAAVADGECDLVCCLVPARTDTAWWNDAKAAGGVVVYFRGRLRFGDAKSCAPFPSAVVVFRNAATVTELPTFPDDVLPFRNASAVTKAAAA